MPIHIAVIKVVSSHLEASACHHESFNHCSVPAWTLVPLPQGIPLSLFEPIENSLRSGEFWEKEWYVPFRVIRACPERVLPVLIMPS